VLTDVLDAVFMTRTRAEWMRILQGQIPAAPVESLDGAIDNPFVAEVGMVQEVPHPNGRTLRMFANPLRFDGARLAQRAAPGLDADGPALRGRFPADAA
jgi:crotonobetainyl-CoA:carnitine CoA-transferase CaiB-like acyl-CoA transferase